MRSYWSLGVFKMKVKCVDTGCAVFDSRVLMRNIIYKSNRSLFLWLYMVSSKLNGAGGGGGVEGGEDLDDF